MINYVKAKQNRISSLEETYIFKKIDNLISQYSKNTSSITIVLYSKLDQYEINFINNKGFYLEEIASSDEYKTQREVNILNLLIPSQFHVFRCQELEAAHTQLLEAKITEEKFNIVLKQNLISDYKTYKENLWAYKISWEENV